MAVDTNTKPQRLLSRRLSIGFALAAAVLGAVALYRTNHFPRTAPSRWTRHPPERA